MPALPGSPPTVAQLEQELRCLAGRVSRQFEIPRHVVSVSDVVPNKRVKWTYAKGLYVFETDGIVKYVGRALAAGMGERIRANIKNGRSAWQAVIADPSTRIRLYIMDVPDVFWSASFEARLIELLAPEHNLRVS